ncbi:peptidase [Thraustotheca clavata]|uniref:Peptidase n=1 Tax=Thraustotheca clavata TaxID=74557 RepID=A0A1W0A6P9_9STRA|nr:peptidase [Thraustotheca clavata]
MRFQTLLFVAITASAKRVEFDRCTAIIVGAQASSTGTPMTTQTNDCSSCDFRLVKIPPLQHQVNASRPVWPAVQYFPRFVGTARGSIEYSQKLLPKGFYNWSDTKPVGYIDQVATTFGYVEGVYGLMNDKQLAFGESTCNARLWSKPIYDGGHALFDIVELSRIALERTSTARDAIKLMGSLAEKYGYYGGYWSGDEEDNLSEAGETLTVTDTTEGWVFHILPDDTGASAVWVAEKVPSNHIAVIANAFVIHAVNLTDSDSFLGSSNLYDVAKRNNFWDGKTMFDFTKVYGHPPSDPWYSTRRQWRVFTLANPSLKLSPNTDAYGSDYPFSIEPLQALSPHDLMRLQRDHYEGTAYDLTKGPAAGPFGNPDRYDPGVYDGIPYERAISIYRTSYSYVTTVTKENANASVVWFGPYAPHATLYTPIYPAALTLPPQLSRGSLLAYNASITFWTNALVGNTAARFYKFAHPVIEAVQLQIEAYFEKALQQDAVVATNTTNYINYITNQSSIYVTKAQLEFTTLFANLMTRFHDGYVFSNFSELIPGVEPMGAPKWWLKETGYYPPKSTQIFVLFAWVAIVLSAAIGFWFGQRSTKQQRGYVHLK